MSCAAGRYFPQHINCGFNGGVNVQALSLIFVLRIMLVFYIMSFAFCYFLLCSLLFCLISLCCSWAFECNFFGNREGHLLPPQVGCVFEASGFTFLTVIVFGICLRLSKFYLLCSGRFRAFLVLLYSCLQLMNKCCL